LANQSHHLKYQNPNEQNLEGWIGDKTTNDKQVAERRDRVAGLEKCRITVTLRTSPEFEYQRLLVPKIESVLKHLPTPNTVIPHNVHRDSHREGYGIRAKYTIYHGYKPSKSGLLRAINTIIPPPLLILKGCTQQNNDYL
jgi:hypothetical protein